jgi:hypothetical protein
MIAQEVEKAVPGWVDTASNGYKRLTFRGFEALTVEAVRELQANTGTTFAALASKIEALAKENASLRDALNTIIAKLGSSGH